MNKGNVVTFGSFSEFNESLTLKQEEFCYESVQRNWESKMKKKIKIGTNQFNHNWSYFVNVFVGVLSLAKISLFDCLLLEFFPFESLTFQFSIIFCNISITNVGFIPQTTAAKSY